ncbi:DUF4382 domain-containing protein [Salinimicrobium sp. GXAS 041]|uniref:DUF4382 domain-containing protein n=1 Tax=Salinimicrobium sp. GXAS 041 TaxID=3400806 RepID=UPI003C7271B6
MKKYSIAFMSFFLSLLAVGCSEDDNSGRNEETSRITVELTDAPGDYEEVWVEVEDVMVKREASDDGEEGWISLEGVRTGTYNLLTLTGGETELLAETEISAGFISEMRLVLGENNTVVVDGVSYDLQTPSAQQSGLKLQVDKELEADIEYNFIMDFDVDQSVVKAGASGNYNLHPVLRLSAMAETGSIMGTIHPTNITSLVVAENASTTVSAYTNSEGEFKLNGLPQGTYKLTVTPDVGSNFKFSVVNNVQVEVGSITELPDVIFLPEG